MWSSHWICWTEGERRLLRSRSVQTDGKIDWFSKSDKLHSLISSWDRLLGGQTSLMLQALLDLAPVEYIIHMSLSLSKRLYILRTSILKTLRAFCFSFSFRASAISFSSLCRKLIRGMCTLFFWAGEPNFKTISWGSEFLFWIFPFTHRLIRSGCIR